MGRQASKDPVESLMYATLDSFKHVNEVIKSVREDHKVLAQATYNGLTGSGKTRFVSDMVEAYGSQARVAQMLELSPGRISQLVNSDKNKKNGK
jgi:hypothetical protein